MADIVAHVKSNHPKVATTKFGLDTTDVLDSRWGKKAAETTPGPGSYGRWSDFSKQIKWVITCSVIHQNSLLVSIDI